MPLKKPPGTTGQREPPRAPAEAVDDEGPDPLALFEALLRRVEARPDPAPERDDFFDHVIQALTHLAIADRGGDPVAREKRAAILDKLAQAIETGRLDADGLMLLGKMLSDSGWRVPDALKAELVDVLETGGSPAPEGAAFDLKTALGQIAEASDGDAFAAYDEVSSVLAAFPSDVAARMVVTLAEERRLLPTLAGFAMHRDPRLAQAAIAALKQAGKAASVESALVERLVRMRPWLPGERQGGLDEAIRTLRANALAPIERARPTALKGFVMACDGTGAGGALAQFKAADGWCVVAAMTGQAGVDHAISFDGLSKRNAEAAAREMRESVTTAQTDVAGVARYLQLALGENVATQTPPPFRLIALAEALGLGPITPRGLSAADLIAEILAEAPEAAKDRAAVAKAYASVTTAAWGLPWYESGEAVERLLGPIRGPKARAKALLSSYLPDRRRFWTRACALTAFALLLDRKTYGAFGLNLALVGREIASGAPLAEIPLMREIAETTAYAYERGY